MRPDLGGGGMSRTFREVEERSRVAVAVACGAGPGRRERLGRVPVERRADDVGGEAEPQQRHQSSHERWARGPRGRPSRHSAVTRWGERERGAEEERGVESPARRPRGVKGAREWALCIQWRWNERASGDGPEPGVPWVRQGWTWADDRHTRPIYGNGMAAVSAC
jgi:hypothetical protein